MRWVSFGKETGIERNGASCKKILIDEIFIGSRINESKGFNILVVEERGFEENPIVRTRAEEVWLTRASPTTEEPCLLLFADN